MVRHPLPHLDHSSEHPRPFDVTEGLQASPQGAIRGRINGHLIPQPYVTSIKLFSLHVAFQIEAGNCLTHPAGVISWKS